MQTSIKSIPSQDIMSWKDFYRDCKVEWNDGQYTVLTDYDHRIEVKSDYDGYNMEIIETEGVVELDETKKNKVYDLVHEFAQRESEETASPEEIREQVIFERTHGYGMI